MNDEEFNECSRELIKQAKRGKPISDDKIELARKVLVHKEKISDVVKPIKMKRQQLSRIVNKIRKIKSKKYPKNWIEVTITVPQEKINEILEIEASEIENITIPNKQKNKKSL